MHWRWVVALAAAVVVLSSRLAHIELLWVEEAYGMAAARELLRGRHLYTDVWFDKPPVYAWFYMLCGAEPGLPLRILGAAFVLLCGWCAWLVARALWNEEEGAIAAALLCFSLTFWIPSAVMAVTPDLLFIPPFLLAIWFSAKSRHVSAGVLIGIAVLCNSKSLVLLPIVAFWAGSQWWKPVAGCAAVQLASLAVIAPAAYFNQVWVWGAGYSADTFVANPAREAFIRTAGWAGFHLSACAATVWCLWRSGDRRLFVWVALSALCVIGGLRFFPRYYFALLPAVCVLGARGLTLMSTRWRIAVLSLLLIPIVRFGPRYLTLALHGPAGWSDAALMQDSRQAAEMVRAAAKPGDRILVWGYRPDIAVWSGLPLATPYIDSQPLSGVLADRHLNSSQPTFPDLAARNRHSLLAQPPPAILVDGLGRLNPGLSLQAYPDLKSWLIRCERIGETSASTVYRLNP